MLAITGRCKGELRGKERKRNEEQGGKAIHDSTRTSVEVKRTSTEKEGKWWQPKTTTKRLKDEIVVDGVHYCKTASLIAARAPQNCWARRRGSQTVAMDNGYHCNELGIELLIH